jgi:hypothetical protein
MHFALSRTVLLICCLALGHGARAQETQVGQTIRVGGRVDIAEPPPGLGHHRRGPRHAERPGREKRDPHLAGGHVLIAAVIGGEVSVAAFAPYLHGPLIGTRPLG